MTHTHKQSCYGAELGRLTCGFTFMVNVTKRGKTATFGPFKSHEAHNLAVASCKGAKVVTVTRAADDHENCHPSNYGKFFLDRIYK